MIRGTNSAAFRKERASELELFAEVLAHYDACKNAWVINSAASQCRTNTPYGTDSWGYEINGLTFEVDTPQNTLPSGAGEKLEVEVNLKLAGGCSDECLADAFEELVLEIGISSLEKLDDRRRLCTWHFDRHIEGGAGESTTVHPLYHFQHGGHRMKEVEDSLGHVLLIPAPRIAFPPMDALLAVDFVLSNFAGKDWCDIKDDGTYRNRVANAQRRYWEPYIRSLLTWWDHGVKDTKEIIRLWPNLLTAK